MIGPLTPDRAWEKLAVRGIDLAKWPVCHIWRSRASLRGCISVAAVSRMTTLRIYDYRDNVLALDLRDLVDLLAPRSLEANWIVSPVTLFYTLRGHSYDDFMIVGPSNQPGQDMLEKFAANGLPVSGKALSEAAHETVQVIWGQFAATFPEQSDA